MNQENKTPAADETGPGLQVATVPANEIVEMRPMDPDFKAETALKVAKEKVKFFNGALAIAIERTTLIDWVDERGNPYLQNSGAQKLKPIFGIYIKEFTLEEKMDKDGHIYFECIMIAGSRFTGEESMFIGGRSGKDPFFANQPGGYDILDLKKAAYSNTEARAIGSLLGLHGLTWEQIKKDKTQSQRVDYKKNEKAPEASIENKNKLQAYIWQVVENDTEAYGDWIESSTTYEKDGKTVKGLRSLDPLRSDKQINFMIGAVKKEAKEKGIELRFPYNASDNPPSREPGDDEDPNAWQKGIDD